MRSDADGASGSRERELVVVRAPVGDLYDQNGQVVAANESAGARTTIVAEGDGVVLRRVMPGTETEEITSHSSINEAQSYAERSYGISPRDWEWPARIVFAFISESLQRDLRLRFPDAHVQFVDDEGASRCEVTDRAGSWGSVGVWPDPDDMLTRGEAEELAADVVECVVNNQWPDRVTAVWPQCPRHGDHPLQVGVRRGLASWVCLADDAVGVPIGDLGGS